ncbi:MAG: porin [Acidobacteria bacterium]|nr:porin [Acidobacteriota bacterium]
MPHKAATLLLAAGLLGRAQDAGLTPREKMLLDRIAKLEERVAALETRTASAPTALPAPTPVAARNLVEPQAAPASQTPLGTVNVFVDSYFGWNTNRPWNGTNALRAYDVTSNGFGLNQTGLMLEKTPDIASGRRWGYRLDLMYGQATEVLQGSPLSEPRPEVYRPVFQSYGTYVAPVGSGLTVDFGKFASSLGYEGNYTKDQINYSRGYLFSLLPFYHMGVRTSYAVNHKLSLGYWLVNGANQTEDFNTGKSQLAQVVLKPAPSLSWTLQYYGGREDRQPAKGLTHIFNTYASWTRGRLTLAGELDAVIHRVEPASAPQRVSAGAAWLRYQLTPRLYFGQRYGRLNDVAGYFTGTAQKLNDLTSTLGFRFGEGFETRFEYRRDFSNVRYFPTANPNQPDQAQDTVTLGLMWWFGGKQGAW